MFKNFKIGTQIGIGITLILIVFVLVVTFVISGLQKSVRSFSEYRTFARESVLSGRVQANMLIASNAARSFLRTRNEKSAEIFDERFAAVRGFALEQQDSMNDSRRLEMSKQLVESLYDYGDHAREAFDLMRRRDVIVHQVLNPQGVRMRKNLTKIMISAYRDNDSEAAYLAGRALEHVLLGRVHLLRFLDENKNEDVLRVREELGDGFEQSYTKMAKVIENPERQEELRQFSATRKIYLKAFEEIVTLIEKRNNLVDRQLEELDHSIADTAERIKLSLKATQDTLGPKIQADNEAMVRTVITGSSLAVALAIFIAWIIIRAITRPIAEFVETVEGVRQSGDLSSRLSLLGKSELGIMADTLNGFLASLEDKAHIAKDVARGELDTQVALLSERDTLGSSLQGMLATLKRNKIEATSRDWIRDGQEALNNQIRGVLEEKELLSRVIGTLARHLDAQQGSFFIFDEDAQTLGFGGGFGTDLGHLDEQSTVKLGEGLVGQVAADRESIIVEQVPDHYVKIHSSLGESLPKSLIIFPLVYSERLLGVIELASVAPFSEAKLSFLNTSRESICIALLAAQRQNELKHLFEKNQEQEVAQKVAVAASEAKSNFLANMSHELRTPLNGVLGYVQILQRDRSFGAKQKRSLNAISNCSEHLLNLINDVLDLSKIEAGKMEIASTATDLRQLIEGVRDIVKPKAEEKGLAFNIKISPEVPRGIITDPIKLRQVLINLLGNSVKFTPRGTVSLRIAENPKGTLRFEIEDTGMGITHSKLKDIFEPFKQAEGGESEGGTGLGLAISLSIAEALGGTLTAISELGEGSCFTLTQPLEEAAETDEIRGLGFSVNSPDSQALFCLPEGKKCSVLIADDRETNRDILDQLLTDAGFETVLADDGDDALDRLRERNFDIVLCDVRMPRMNGIEVVKEIRRDDKLKSTKIFAVTASVFPEFRDEALEAGFDDFLMKPLRVSELAQKMSQILDVEFIYPDFNDDNDIAGELDPIDHFEVLSEELIDELVAAAKMRNVTKLAEIGKRLLQDEQTAAAGHYLEGLLVTFDFAGLKELVDTLTPLRQTSEKQNHE